MSDRFTSKRPTFQPSSNQNAIDAITPNQKDTTPPASVVERLEQEGHTELAAMLAHAQAAAKENATIIESKRASARVPRDERFSTRWAESEPKPEVATPTKQVAKFQPSDVVDDMTFIRKTRDSNIHTPEMTALFWANGGERHMVSGLSYAQAFGNLRQEKMRNLRGVKAPSTPYQHHGSLPQGTKVITPGMPTIADRERHMKAQTRQTRVVANEKWAGIRK
jgi:hypothetical protein